MNLAELGGPFTSQPCGTCGEDRYVDEPCPKCTAGDYGALMDRLEAAMVRQVFLLRIIERMMREQENASSQS